MNKKKKSVLIMCFVLLLQMLCSTNVKCINCNYINWFNKSLNKTVVIYASNNSKFDLVLGGVIGGKPGTKVSNVSLDDMKWFAKSLDDIIESYISQNPKLDSDHFSSLTSIINEVESTADYDYLLSGVMKLMLAIIPDIKQRSENNWDKMLHDIEVVCLEMMNRIFQTPTPTIYSLDYVKDLVFNFNILASVMWMIWAIIVLAGSLKDKNGPGLQTAIWQLVGALMIIIATYIFADSSDTPSILSKIMKFAGVSAKIGGALWAIWGIVALAGALKDKTGPALQSAVWQIVGGIMIMVVAIIFSNMVQVDPTPSPTSSPTTMPTIPTASPTPLSERYANNIINHMSMYFRYPDINKQALNDEIKKLAEDSISSWKDKNDPSSKGMYIISLTAKTINVIQETISIPDDIINYVVEEAQELFDES